MAHKPARILREPSEAKTHFTKTQNPEETPSFHVFFFFFFPNLNTNHWRKPLRSKTHFRSLFKQPQNPKKGFHVFFSSAEFERKVELGSLTMADERERENYTLVVRRPCFGLPTACPSCLPVFLYLRFANTPFHLDFNLVYPDSGKEIFFFFFLYLLFFTLSVFRIQCRFPVFHIWIFGGYLEFCW